MPVPHAGRVAALVSNGSDARPGTPLLRLEAQAKPGRRHFRRANGAVPVATRVVRSAQWPRATNRAGSEVHADRGLATLRVAMMRTRVCGGTRRAHSRLVP